MARRLSISFFPGWRAHPARRFANTPISGRKAIKSQYIWKAERFIQESLAENLSLGKVAKAVDLTANYFSEKFKEAIGVKFVDYVAQLRVAKAKELLHDSNLPISTIAATTGFQSYSQFNRVFKKLSRKSPREYRASAMKRRVAAESEPIRKTE